MERWQFYNINAGARQFYFRGATRCSGFALLLNGNGLVATPLKNLSILFRALPNFPI